jgi:hypothetical protein
MPKTNYIDIMEKNHMEEKYQLMERYMLMLMYMHLFVIMMVRLRFIRKIYISRFQLAVLLHLRLTEVSIL